MSTSIRICSYLLLPLIYLLVNVKIAQLGESFPITIVTFLPVLLLLFLERISVKKLMIALGIGAGLTAFNYLFGQSLDASKYVTSTMLFVYIVIIIGMVWSIRFKTISPHNHRKILRFFYLVVGLVVAVFEAAVEYQGGRTTAVRDLALGSVKGFLAVSLFTTVPVELYKLCIDLQGSLSSGIAGASNTEGVSNMARAAMGGLNGYGVFIALFLLILMGYSVIKIFFANLKRGGILLIQIAVGSLYLFSIPRGYVDGFYGWCRQVIGLCLTAFLQTTILIAGLMVWNENMLLGCGLMLSSSEIPRIAQQFGLETSTRANIMQAVYATQTVVNLGRSLTAAVK